MASTRNKTMVVLTPEAQLDRLVEVNEAAHICRVVPAFHTLGLIMGEGGDRP